MIFDVKHADLLDENCAVARSAGIVSGASRVASTPRDARRVASTPASSARCNSWVKSWHRAKRSAGFLAIALANTASSGANSGTRSPIGGGGAITCLPMTAAALGWS